MLPTTNSNCQCRAWNNWQLATMELATFPHWQHFPPSPNSGSSKAAPRRRRQHERSRFSSRDDWRSRTPENAPTTAEGRERHGSIAQRKNNERFNPGGGQGDKSGDIEVAVRCASRCQQGAAVALFRNRPVCLRQFPERCLGHGCNRFDQRTAAEGTARTARIRGAKHQEHAHVL